MVVVKQPGWTRVSHGSEVKRLWDKSEGHSFDTYREHSELFLFLSFGPKGSSQWTHSCASCCSFNINSFTNTNSR